MNELALFAGAGGGILGGQLLGWRTVCAVERDAYAAAVLAQRQNDGLLDLFPIWSDICTFDGKPWRGIVDVVSGGFPCQDISSAGKGAGIDGERSGLWGEMARIIREVRPRFVFVENSPVLTSRGLGTVLGDLAALGFDAEYGVLGASDVGAPHKRERIWIVADSDSLRKQQLTETWNKARHRLSNGCQSLANTLYERPQGWGELGKSAARRKTKALDGHDSTGCSEEMADTDEIGRQRRPGMLGQRRRAEFANCRNDVPDTIGEQYQGQSHAGSRQWEAEGVPFVWRNWSVEPAVGRVAHGVANRVDKLKALGNGQVPACMAEAFCRLIKRRKQNIERGE